MTDAQPDDRAPARSAARADLAGSVRRLIEATTTGSTSEPGLAAAKNLVDAAITALGAAPDLTAHRVEVEAGLRPTLNPFGSVENPLAPPLIELDAEPGEFVAQCVLSSAYEGPPGRVHGGVVTGILDHASGHALRAVRILAVSVSLRIDLHHPTPYGEPLIVSARIGEREGRKIWVDASIATSQGLVTASSRTLMLELREAPAWAQAALR
jgi:acyl-coenzyme A thioesterase PaaI-like protein